MLSLGLSTTEQRAYNLALITGYELAVTLQVMDLNHNKVGDVSSMLVDGQVNKDYWAPVTSNATLTLRDPLGRSGFDTLNPSDGAHYADRMMRITYSIWSPLLPRWVHCPLFTGPITAVSRDDAILSVECQGKESLHLPPTMAWTTGDYAKGTKTTTALRSLLSTKAGERYIELAEVGTVLPRAYGLVLESVVWEAAQWMAGNKHIRQLFYDARGVAKLRNRPKTPVLTFTEKHLTSVPKLDYDMSRVRNCVMVRGAMIGNRQIVAIRHLSKTHPLSSTSLAIGPKTRPLVEVVEDSALDSPAKAEDVAADTLAALQVATVGFDFDAKPQPHLEPGDIVGLSTRTTSLNLLVNKFSIPLKAPASMSMGDHRKISANVRRLRRR